MTLALCIFQYIIFVFGVGKLTHTIFSTAFFVFRNVSTNREREKFVVVRTYFSVRKDGRSQ